MDNIEQILKAFRWKLGIPVDKDASAQITWSQLSNTNNRVGYQKCAASVAESLGKMFEEAIRYKLDLYADSVEHRDNVDSMESLCQEFGRWLSGNEVKRSPLVSYRMRKALQKALNVEPKAAVPAKAASTPQPITRSPSVSPQRAAISYAQQGGDAFGSGSGQKGTTMANTIPSPAPNPKSPVGPRDPRTPQPDVSAVRGGAPHVEPQTNNVAQAEQKPPPPIPSAQWKYIPVPDEPDKHDEYDARTGTMPGDLTIVGARVRGKKHKHEGTNCDDWFEFASSGDWTIIAVSDGAGSKKFSRVGAVVSCKAAVQYLAGQLREHQLQVRDKWSAETFRRDDTTHAFAEPDLEKVQTQLHNAIQVAYDAVCKATEERCENQDYTAVLGGRKLDVNDLSSTLLLVVHTKVRFQAKDYSFALACQVGDGMSAAVTSEGSLCLIGIADSGEFSGETDFLTSKKKIEPANLSGKTILFFSPLRALMVMTDGVADDYFPNDPGLLRLYADLVLNRIIGLDGIADGDVAAAVSGTPLKDMSGVEVAITDCLVEAERLVAPDRTENLLLRSASAYAEKVSLPVEALAKNQALLAAGCRGSELGNEKTPQDRLKVWLDSYHVRGSFDDRTLVALYSGKAS